MISYRAKIFENAIFSVAFHKIKNEMNEFSLYQSFEFVPQCNIKETMYINLLVSKRSRFSFNSNMKIKQIFGLLFLAHYCLGIPPFLKELGAGPLAALGVIANICGDEPAVACTCRNKDADEVSEEEDNDLDSVELVTGIPACIPDECICSDGTTQTLPKIPER